MAKTGKLFLVVATDGDEEEGVKLDMWINPDEGDIEEHYGTALREVTEVPGFGMIPDFSDNSLGRLFALNQSTTAADESLMHGMRRIVQDAFGVGLRLGIGIGALKAANRAVEFVTELQQRPRR